MVDDGVTGFTVPTRDWAGLADAIEKLVMSPDLRADMGGKMREKIVARFGEAQVVRQTIELYLGALDSFDVGRGSAPGEGVGR